MGVQASRDAWWSGEKLAHSGPLAPRWVNGRAPRTSRLRHASSGQAYFATLAPGPWVWVSSLVQDVQTDPAARHQYKSLAGIQPFDSFSMGRPTGHDLQANWSPLLAAPAPQRHPARRRRIGPKRWLQRQQVRLDRMRCADKGIPPGGRRPSLRPAVEVRSPWLMPIIRSLAAG